MASAVLSSQNEPYWGDRKVYMRKFNNPATTGTNNNNKRPIPPLHFNPNPSPNPNPTSRALIRPVNPSQIHDPVAHFRQRDMCPPQRETTMQSRQTVSLGDLSSHGRYVRYDLATLTRRELFELKRRLICELEKVRFLKIRLDTYNQDARPVNPYQPPQNSSIRPTPPPPLHTTVTDATASAETKIPNQAKRKTPASQGLKRSNPFSKEMDSNPKRSGVDSQAERVVSSMMKRCGQILGKLMKLKFAWVFQKPVDVAGLGLFDYHQIIKKPMDLGTVKVNLGSNVYKSPLDFAADVRLTFHNAMVYNPVQHDVHVMAQKMLAKFDEMFNPAFKKFEDEQFRVCSKIPCPVAHPVAAEPVGVAEGGKTADVVAAEQGVVEMAVVKERVLMRKPKAKEVNKREMSFAEKTSLGKELEELPQEKMLQLLSILKKKSEYFTTQDGDEIELDMEVMDKETLWELDRFVNNYKKTMSKLKRQGDGGGINSHNPPPTTLPVPDPQTYNNDTRTVTNSEMMVVDMWQKGGGGGGGEEDVDIGEEMPVENYSPVEIERDVIVTASPSGRSGSSSSSGTDSSSSSGRQESSSGSDSDADCGQSPYGDGRQSADPAEN